MNYTRYFLENEADTTRLALFERKKEEDYPAHFHDFYEIEFIVSGKCIQYINGEAVECDANSIVFFTPMDLHSVTFLEPTEIVNLNFDTSWIDPELRPLCDSSMYTHNTKDIYINILREEYKLKLDYNLILERNLLNCIITEILRNAKIVRPKKQNNVSFEIARYIQNNYNTDITLESISKIFGYTPNYLSSNFHKTIGKTIKRFIVDVRLERALRMLLTTDASVTNICYSAGFTSLAHFLRTFKAKYGQSPNSYRKNIDK
ncbi:MAG: helix-turn-helix transcriptional regulator [Clostridia bacterium]|nr:helix-turn-helix transcriptional regulator [Clostridia bacterium]